MQRALFHTQFNLLITLRNEFITLQVCNSSNITVLTEIIYKKKQSYQTHQTFAEKNRRKFNY